MIRTASSRHPSIRGTTVSSAAPRRSTGRTASPGPEALRRNAGKKAVNVDPASAHLDRSAPETEGGVDVGQRHTGPSAAERAGVALVIAEPVEEVEIRERPPFHGGPG